MTHATAAHEPPAKPATPATPQPITTGPVDRLFTQPFTVSMPPALTMPVVLNSPHSGRHYPASFVASSRLDAKTLRRSEDAYVDRLFEIAVPLGAPMMTAHFPRAYLDVNREPYELDPAMFSDPLPDYVNSGSIRVAGGLGTIARVVSEHEEIYRGKLTVAEAHDRIDTLHKPYHARLDALLNQARDRFGSSLLIDCHSMPSTDQSGNRAMRPDFVLGDRCGSSCAPQIVNFLETHLSRLGFQIARNQPYAGGYITERYGKPSDGRHALQIEINRALYMDEAELAPHSGLHKLQAVIAELIEALGERWPSLLSGYQIAAE